MDFWKVNSYGYPNPFSSEQSRAYKAWQTFLSFFDFVSYSRLKEFWNSSSAPWTISPHAVESWKATFEEFGLLYVLSRTDDICITPAGIQFREAGESGNLQQFVWIGLSLLLRYPLIGPPRRTRGGQYDTSDLLLYWFLHAATRELNNYFWRSELDRVLCRVFRTDEAEAALSDIRRLRNGDLSLIDLPLAGDPARGAFYNSLNQVLVHGSMNYILWGKNNNEIYYDGSTDTRIFVREEWLPYINAGLGGVIALPECDESAGFILRMPTAPDFTGDELGYFEYLGQKVAPLPPSQPNISYVDMGGTDVAILREGTHYNTTTDDYEIVGTIAQLCSVAKSQRIILSHELSRTYFVENKSRTASGRIVIRIRPARRISDPMPLQPYLERGNDND